MAKTDKAAEAAAAPQADLVEGLVAQWRVEHDGTAYGPGQPGGEALPALPRAQAEALLLSGAALAPALAA